MIRLRNNHFVLSHKNNLCKADDMFIEVYMNKAVFVCY